MTAVLYYRWLAAGFHDKIISQRVGVTEATWELIGGISVICQGRWGGIWRAPRDYSFVATNNKQTNVQLMKIFDKWKYDDYGIEERMPWIAGAKLTTSRNATGDRQWGTLIGKNA